MGLVWSGATQYKRKQIHWISAFIHVDWDGEFRNELSRYGFLVTKAASSWKEHRLGYSETDISNSAIIVGTDRQNHCLALPNKEGCWCKRRCYKYRLRLNKKNNNLWCEQLLFRHKYDWICRKWGYWLLG